MSSAGDDGRPDCLLLRLHPDFAKVLVFPRLQSKGLVEVLPKWAGAEPRLVALPYHEPFDAESALLVRLDLGWTRIVGVVDVQPHYSRLSCMSPKFFTSLDFLPLLNS